jgi:hypothetical protein
VKVYAGTWAVDVEVSREWIISDWEAHSIIEHTCQAAQHRKLKTAHQGEFTYYTWTLTLEKLTTRSIIENIHFLYIEKGDFSNCLKYFVQVLSKYGIPETRRFLFVHEIATAILTKKQAKTITTIHEFQRKMKGYLKLTVFFISKLFVRDD